MAKIKLEFKGFDEAIARLKSLDGDVKKTVEDSLTKCKRAVHVNLGKEMKKHNRTYTTSKSLNHGSHVIWEGGNIASIKVGFSIDDGGLPSIFLMYGTPRMEKDQALYDAVYGRKAKAQIRKIQKDDLFNEIVRLDKK